MTAPRLSARIERRLTEMADGLASDTPLAEVTGISQSVADQYAESYVGEDSRVERRFPELADRLRAAADLDRPRFETTRRIATVTAAFAAETDERVSLYDRRFGILPVRTVGEFVASTATWTPIAKSYRSEAVREVENADVDPGQFGIPSDEWLQACYIGKSNHADLYDQDLSRPNHPVRIDSLGSRYWDPGRYDIELPVSEFVPARDVSDPVEIDGTEYVVLSDCPTEHLADEEERASVTYVPTYTGSVTGPSVSHRRNYADESVLREHVLLAPSLVENPFTGDPTHVGGVTRPVSSGYARHFRYTGEDSPVYGVTESLLFERLFDE